LDCGGFSPAFPRNFFWTNRFTKRKVKNMKKDRLQNKPNTRIGCKFSGFICRFLRVRCAIFIATFGFALPALKLE